MGNLICDECEQIVRERDLMLVEDDEGNEVMVCKRCLVAILEELSDVEEE
jgi:hypothetical protein